MSQYGIRKFHRDVYFPDALKQLCLAALTMHAGTYHITHHARTQLQERAICLPRRLPLTASIIEATVAHRALEKFLIRFPATDTDDIVVGIDATTGNIITVFWNRHDDHHYSLRREQYVRAA